VAPKGGVSVQTWDLACSTVVELVVGKLLVEVLGGIFKEAVNQRVKVVEKQLTKEVGGDEGKKKY